MADLEEGFEQRDNVGSTKHFNGSVNSVISIPSFSDKVISEVMIQNISIPANRILQVSFDGGSNFISVGRNSHIAWTPKGYQTQIKIKSPTGSLVSYEILINFEEF